jgi:hypothetical protein
VQVALVDFPSQLTRLVKMRVNLVPDFAGKLKKVKTIVVIDVWSLNGSRRHYRTVHVHINILQSILMRIHTKK